MIYKFNIKNIYLKISNIERIAFITTILIGLLTHIFMFTNVLPNWDSMYNFKSNSIWIDMGRWFLNESMKVSSIYDLPWIIGILSLIFIGITSAIIVNLLEIKRKISAITISAIIVTFPVVTSTFSYLFLADGYMMGMMLSTISIFITKKYNKGYWGGGIILAFSIGIYQTNLAFAGILALLIIIKDIIDSDSNVSDVINCSIKFILTAIIGGVVYFFILKLFILILGKGLGEYQGANSGFIVNIYAIKRIIYEFLYCFVYITGGVKKYRIILVGSVFICLCVMLLSTILKNKIYKNIGKIILLLILGITIPFITGFSYFISDKTYYHMVMRMCWVLFFVATVMFWEIMIKDKKINSKFKYIYNNLPIFIMWMVIWNFILVANISYLNMYQRYKKDYTLATRLLNRIEQSEYYSSNIPIIFIGNEYSKKIDNIYDEDIRYVTGANGNSIFNSDFHLKQFIKYYLGVELVTPSEEKIEEIKNSYLIDEIGVFPDNDFIKIIDNVMVVKF